MDNPRPGHALEVSLNITRLSEQFYAIKNLSNPVDGQTSDEFANLRSVNRKKLRDDNYAPLREVSLFRVQHHVARRVSPFEI